VRKSPVVLIHKIYNVFISRIINEFAFTEISCDGLTCEKDMLNPARIRQLRAKPIFFMIKLFKVFQHFLYD